MSDASAKSDDFFAQFGDVIRTAEKLKRVMMKKSLRRAKAKCPRCGGWLHGSINGKRDHLHMSCEGMCGMAMME